MSLPHFFLHESFNMGQIRLHPEFHCPRPSGSALKVCGGLGGGWGVVGWVVDKPIIIITLH